MLTDSLKNKVALVTGAGHGIGKEIAKTLASCGAFVIVNYNSSPDAAEQTVKEIIKQGGMAAPVQCDVSDFDACGKMMEMIINNYGHLDILVNNAGITRDGLIMKMSEEDFDRVLDTNLKGAFHTIRHAVAPGFIETEMTEAMPEAAREAVKKQIPLQRTGRVSDVAGVAAFLASDLADYITGQVISVDGGMHM